MSNIFEIVQAGVGRIRGTMHCPGATPGDVLTVQGDGSIAAAPGGGGAGVQTVTVPVGVNDILDLANTPVILVTAPPGFAAVVVGPVTLVYTAGATPYTDGGGNLNVETYGITLLWATFPAAGFWDQATDQVYVTASLGPDTSGALTDADGVNVTLRAQNNPTLGDGTLTVTLAYFLAPTV